MPPPPLRRRRPALQPGNARAAASLIAHSPGQGREGQQSRQEEQQTRHRETGVGEVRALGRCSRCRGGPSGGWATGGSKNKGCVARGDCALDATFEETVVWGCCPAGVARLCPIPSRRRFRTGFPSKTPMVGTCLLIEAGRELPLLPLLLSHPCTQRHAQHVLA